MKKKTMWLILSCLMVAALLLASCEPAAPEEEVEEEGEEEEEEVTAEEEEAAPTPGEWIASIDIGELRFTVNPAGTGIAKIFLHIPGEFKCGISTVTNSRLTFEKPSLWPITGGQFTVEASGRYWDIVIKGSFDETGTHASGTWEISAGGTTCQSGIWEASR